MGVVLHRWKLLQRTSFATGLALFIGSIIAFGLFQHYRLTDLGSAWMRGLVGEAVHHQLTFSRFVLTDYLLGLIVAANFVGARAIAPVLLGRILLPLEQPIRWLADYTFSLYLMHQPLLLFFGAAIDGDPRGYLYFIEVLGAILVTVWLVGSLTEGRRHLLRAWLLARLQSLQGSRWLAARSAR
jgi:peptidoglycan/LPS O-acetylase OafA/YrhL